MIQKKMKEPLKHAYSFMSLRWDLYKKGSDDPDVWWKARQSNCEDYAYDHPDREAPFVR